MFYFLIYLLNRKNSVLVECRSLLRFLLHLGTFILILLLTQEISGNFRTHDLSKGSLYSIAERGVPELIPVLGSQPAGDVSHKPGGRLPLHSARPAVIPQPLKGLLPVSLLGEQRHDGCEQFA